MSPPVTCISLRTSFILPTIIGAPVDLRLTVAPGHRPNRLTGQSSVVSSANHVTSPFRRFTKPVYVPPSKMARLPTRFLTSMQPGAAGDLLRGGEKLCAVISGSGMPASIPPHLYGALLCLIRRGTRNTAGGSWTPTATFSPPGPPVELEMVASFGDDQQPNRRRGIADGRHRPGPGVADPELHHPNGNTVPTLTNPIRSGSTRPPPRPPPPVPSSPAPAIRGCPLPPRAGFRRRRRGRR